MAVNPLSRREVMKFGAFTTVGGVLTPGISLAQAIATDTRGIVARDIELNVGGTKIPAYDAWPERQGRSPIVVATRTSGRRDYGAFHAVPPRASSSAMRGSPSRTRPSSTRARPVTS